MDQNLISQDMTDVQRDALIADLTSFDTKFQPYKVSLTPEDTKKLLKFKVEDVALLQLALTFAQQNPGAIPADVNVTEFAKDVAFAQQAQTVNGMAQQTADQTNTTVMAACSDGYSAALDIYRVAKAQGRTPQNQTFLDAFGARFARGPRKATPNP